MFDVITDEKIIDYPYDKEKLLIYSIIHHDTENSRRYLNEVLGHIFFSSVSDLGVIKARAIELTVMVSRAVLDAGADKDKISSMTQRFISAFLVCSTIEEICRSLNDILKRLTQEAFEFAEIRRFDVMSRAITYMKANYMRKLLIIEVAGYVFLSPSYFSKIFKREMKCSFNDYLNYIRVEKSKILLLDSKVSLVEIADRVGFYDQSYLNNTFKKVTGMTPKKFRESGGKLSMKWQ